MDYRWLAEAVPAVTTGAGAGPARVPSGAPRISIRAPHQRVMHTDAVRLFARCDVACKVRFAGRAETASGSVILLRKRLFRGERDARVLPVTSERALALELTRGGRRVLRRQLDRRGRVAVVITASVQGANVTRTVRKRIVLHTTLIRNGKRISYR